MGMDIYLVRPIFPPAWAHGVELDVLSRWVSGLRCGVSVVGSIDYFTCFPDEPSREAYRRMWRRECLRKRGGEECAFSVEDVVMDPKADQMIVQCRGRDSQAGMMFFVSAEEEERYSKVEYGLSVLGEVVAYHRFGYGLGPGEDAFKEDAHPFWSENEAYAPPPFLFSPDEAENYFNQVLEDPDDVKGFIEKWKRLESEEPNLIVAISG